MKRFCFLLIWVGAILATVVAQAQEERRAPRAGRGSERSRQANENNSGLPELTVRAQNMNQLLTQDVGNARWMRVIYRQLNMLNEKNAPLYYPVAPMNGMMNLFTTIFQLAGDGKLPVYQYLDGYEIFDDAHRTNFKDVLDRFEILYETVPGNAQERFVINESDVPSEEVKSFYVKEAWYFDQNNSVYDVKILAICPIITRMMDIGDQTTPMFWVPYEEIRPYVANNYIMTSNVNNAKTFTVDDYFRRRMFEGEIIKTENLLNLPLQAYCPTPDSLALEREKIENELLAFEKALWYQPDTTAQVASTGKKASGRSARKSDAKSNAKSGKKAKEKAKEKEKKSTAAPKAEKSAPTRSVRRGR
ncbi:MAG: gliding motility protein GldN [Tannerella sp.]|jgi:gliding motility associated protien GldN|nr:gliding motility protein GldN [Tannerella sp.]